MLKSAQYVIHFCKNDRGPRVDAWLARAAGAGFVRNDASKGGVVECPSREAWNRWWSELEAAQVADELESMEEEDTHDSQHLRYAD